MKVTLFVLALVISINSYAQLYSKKKLVQMSVTRLFPDGSNKDNLANMSDLVEEWNKVFDAQNLLHDKNKHRINWENLFPITKKKVHKIEGQRIFYSLFPKTYRYDIVQDPQKNQLIVHVKMHFYPSKTYLKKAEKFHATNHPDKKYYLLPLDLKKAVLGNVIESEKMWNAQMPANVRFKFEMMEKAQDAHYSIKLVSFFGALYDKFIMAPASSSILAHEIGHMVGLDDEYSPITSNIIPVNSLLESVSARHANRDMDYTSYKDMRCNLDSIMCLKDTIYNYHLNHILGRIRP
jgi:hypothetical protein